MKPTHTILQTNMVIKKGTPLQKKGTALIRAAYEYWLEYNETCGPGAVVVLESSSGHMVLITRGEYKRDLLGVVDNISGHPPLEHPFEEI